MRYVQDKKSAQKMSESFVLSFTAWKGKESEGVKGCMMNIYRNKTRYEEKKSLY